MGWDQKSTSTVMSIFERLLFLRDLSNVETLAGFWFFKGLRGFRQPVGAIKAPTGPLTPGSGATNILDNGETGRLG